MCAILHNCTAAPIGCNHQSFSRIYHTRASTMGSSIIPHYGCCRAHSPGRSRSWDDTPWPLVLCDVRPSVPNLASVSPPVLSRLYGISLSQTYSYYKRSSKDSRNVKIVVCVAHHNSGSPEWLMTGILRSYLSRKVLVPSLQFISNTHSRLLDTASMVLVSHASWYYLVTTGPEKDDVQWYEGRSIW